MATIWKPIKTIPRTKMEAQFKFPNGKIVTGKWTTYWCGSDCPCCDKDDPLYDPEEHFEPMCWCVDGYDDDPVEWASL